jgi:hypothetical protein
MPSPKVVFIARFEVPTEPVFCGWPEHKIQNGFTTDGANRAIWFGLRCGIILLLLVFFALLVAACLPRERRKAVLQRLRRVQF